MVLSEVDEYVSARWVLRIEPEEVLENHTVAIKGGKIVDIFPSSSEQSKKYAPKVTTHLKGALMPGFVNAHAHSAMVYMRGISDDILLHEWLEKCIWPLEGQVVGHDYVRDGTTLAILEMLLSGTTTFNEMYWFPEAVCEAVIETGIRAAVGMITIEFPFGSYGTDPDDYLAKGQKARDKYGAGDDGLLSWTVSLHAPYTVSDSTMSKAKALSDRLDTKIHIHLHETQTEVDDSIAQKKDGTCHLSDQPCSPLANLKRLGLLNSKLIAVHMTALTDEEISWVGASGASVVHCPSSNLKLASGFCKVGQLVDAGANVAIGTDGASSNNTVDMIEEMHLAAILAKGVARDARVVPAHTALRMATLNGARALGLDHRIGSLEVGKEADMIHINFDEPRVWPRPSTTGVSFDPVTHIVYSGRSDMVSDVWVKGRRLVQNRQPLTIDMNMISTKAQAWGEKITGLMKEMRRSSAEEPSC